MAEISNLPGMKMPIAGYDGNVAGTQTETLAGAGAGVGAAGKAEDVQGILPGGGVNVTDPVQGGNATEGTAGAANVPALDEPNAKPNVGELLEKLVSYLRLDNDEQKLELSKQRIEANRDLIEAEHTERKGKLNLFLAVLGDKEARADIYRSGDVRAIRMMRAIDWIANSARDGWFFSRFHAAGMLEGLLEDVLGKDVSFFDTLRFINRLEDAFSKADFNHGRGAAKMLAAVAVMSLISGASSLIPKEGGGDYWENRMAMRACMRTAVAAGTMAMLAFSAKGEIGLDRHEEIDAGEIDKLIAMMQQGMDEDAEKLEQILVQLTAGIAGALALVAAATDTDSQIDRMNLLMA